MDIQFTPVLPNGKPRSSRNIFELIHDDLEEVEAVLSQTLTPFQNRFGILIEHLQHYRGKRLRPALMLLVAHACGKVSHKHSILAAVVEMIHTATLVHDDVLDEAIIRRHLSTVNANWDNKISILLGDLLFTHAFHLTSSIGDVRACEWIGEATNRVCAGELNQLIERGNLSLSEKEYFTIIEGKTAALTEVACRLGALYSGADEKTIQAFAEYGRCLGIAFQIADDVLDLVGEEQKTGKTLGTDLEQQKLTLPLIYLFDRIPSSEADKLRQRLQNWNPEDRAEISVLVQKTNALQDARKCGAKYILQAQNALNGIPRSIYRDALSDLVGWTLKRDN
jgi:octaprenyl-diphosphate synthase